MQTKEISPITIYHSEQYHFACAKMWELLNSISLPKYSEGKTCFQSVDDRAIEMHTALEDILRECGTDDMECGCAPPGNGEACPRCEIRHIARTALRK